MFRRLLPLLLLLALACGDDSTMTSPDGGGEDAGGTCTGDDQCDDGLFCNGPETCAPGTAGAGADGCLPGEAPCDGDGCDEAEDACEGGCGVDADADGDGFDSVECGGNDCDDTDPTRFPTALELCDPDGVDEDCDPVTFGTRDGDGDGFLDARCCNGDNCGDDCNDTRPGTNPGQAELCDGEDNDCDGSVDEGALRTFYLDMDRDGRGDPSAPTVEACFAPDGYADVAGDCDDADPARHEGLPEVCDAGDVDENCDGVANPAELCSCDAGETRGCLAPGACAAGTEACVEGMFGMCSIIPVAEACNDIDDDCDGRTDEMLRVTCYEDPDDDGYADVGAAMVEQCPASGRAEVMGCPFQFTHRAPFGGDLDCMEGDDDVYPGAPELCNGGDDDCDTTADEGLRIVVRYIDADGDGFRGSPVDRCEGDPDSVAVSEDCNETDTSVYIGATEICDGKDNNCSLGGAAAGGPDVFEDQDGDMFAPLDALCDGGPYPKTDCNDDPLTGATDNPDATEICSGRDTNCNGEIDEDPAANDSCVAADAAAGCATDGTCRVFACEYGFADCNGDYDDGCEVDTLADPTNCGGCGIACGGGGSCTDGRCADPVEVEAGNLHTCVRYSDGSVGCAGRNRNVQLGDGTRTDRRFLSPVVGVSTASDLALGQFHTCTLLTDGTAMCWGSNGDGGGVTGQLGDGTTAGERFTAVPVVDLTGATQLVAGASHTCALLGGGGVRCWGVNANGQLGNGGGPNRNRPVDVMDLSDATHIAAGGNTTCAVRSGGSVVCWGRNNTGQVGDGTTTDRVTPVAVQDVTGAVEVGVGGSHACARLSGGGVRCWGLPSIGRLGDGTTGSTPLTAQTVVGLSGASSLDVGTNHSCVVRGSNGQVSCWGGGLSGQLGDGARMSSSTFVDATDMTGALHTGLGQEHSCALRQGGKIDCWGANGFGQLANGTSDLSADPVPVPGLQVLARISIGNDHACTLRASGTMVCWGENRFGQLGLGHTMGAGLNPRENGVLAREVAAGGEYTCAVEGGDVECWGRGLGFDSVTPVAYPSLADVVQIESSTRHVCARDLSNELYCWGVNGNGQIGNGSTATVTTPFRVPLADVRDADASFSHTCAALGTGEMYCWGANSHGQVGTGSAGGSRRTPFEVVHLDDATRVATSNSVSCALRATGEVLCFGRRLVGGAFVAVPESWTIDFPAGRIVDIHAGAGICAVYATGEVVCLNSQNADGEMGQGHFLPVEDPSQVVDHADFLRIAHRGATCGIRDEGRALMCWGDGNRTGQGSFTDLSRPTAVPTVP